MQNARLKPLHLLLLTLLTPLSLCTYSPSTIIKTGHIHQLHSTNIKYAIKKHTLLFLFIYGDWCPHAKSMLKSYKEFSLYLKSQNSKIETGIYHLKNAKNFKYANITHNPTLLVFLKGKVVAKNFWMEDFNHALHVIEYKVMKKYDFEFVDYMAFLDYEREKVGHKHSLVFVGKKSHGNYGKFLEFVFTKKVSEFKYFRIDEREGYRNGHVYLFRKEDLVEILVLPFPDLFESNRWLYHHANPHLLKFPEPALTHILEHKNPGLILFFKNKKDLLLEENEKIEADFEIASESLYKSFKITKCFIEDEPLCKKFLKKNLKGDISQKYPRLIISIPISDFRSEILGLKYPKKITLQNILNFTNTFHDEDYPLEILTEKKSENKYQITAETIFDEMHLNSKNDRIIFYYRGLLENDKKLLDQYIDLIEEIEELLEEKVFFYFYDVDQNAVFDDFEGKNDFPAVRVFKKGFGLSGSKLFKKVERFLEIVMFLNDQISLDNSEVFMDYSR